MCWHVAMENAEKTLKSPLIPSSLELISLIKKVNPTSLSLSQLEREYGYEVKSRLQNLLLELYGEAFYLDPHPLNPKIALIKHAALPSVDACHTEFAALSGRALDSVADRFKPAPATARKPTGKEKKKGEGVAGYSPGDTLKGGLARLAEYDFEGAAELLAGIRISSRHETAIVERAARTLLEAMGAYPQAVELLLGQQGQFLRDARLRVLLARAYHLLGAAPEARAIFDNVSRGELDKEALVAYAEIAYRDANLVLALELLKTAEETEGYVGRLKELKKEVEEAMQAEVEPLLGCAFAALGEGREAQAELMARQVLLLWPDNKGARTVLARIDAGRRAAEVAGLWERLGQAEGCEARLELLEKLLERDGQNRERILALFDAEKNRKKEQSVQARLDRLPSLVAEGAWGEAFEIVWWVHGQEGREASFRQACNLSPYLAVLCDNKRLDQVSEKGARQLWLDFVKAAASFRSGRPEGRLEILEGVRHYFERYSLFREVYEPALAAERERAREEIKAHLLAASREETALSQAQHCLNVVRKAAACLPAEESAGYLASIEERIAELTPTPSEEVLIREYKYAARAGNREKAAKCRSHISGQAALDEYDAELVREFAIERSPVQLEWSDNLEVDLSSDQPLQWVGSSDRHIYWREADDAVVILHLGKMTATRFSSPHFKDLHFADCIPPDDVFLLRDMKTHLSWWRAELSEEKSAFTACFDIRDFVEQGDEYPVGFFLSSERDTDYYAVIRQFNDLRPGRVVRKRVGNIASPVSDIIKIGNLPEIVMRRLSWHPDKFIVGGKDQMKVCAKNLTSDYSVAMHPDDIWSIDFANGHLYYFDRAMLKRTDLEFGATEMFLESRCCYFFNEHHYKLTLCPANNTLMISVGPRAALYDFTSNWISAPFTLGRVVGTKPAEKLYTYDYCGETRTLKLRDITADVSKLLEWEEAVMPPANEEDDPDWHLKLHKQIYLGFPGNEPPQESGEEAAAGEGAAPPIAPEGAGK